MASDNDILGKADGLMRRNSVGVDTGSVPLLTDLVAGGASPARAPASDLAREVFTRVMVEVEGRLAADLERRLTEHLVPQVRAAIANAIGDLHQELASAVGDAVNRALESRHLK